MNKGLFDCLSFQRQDYIIGRLISLHSIKYPTLFDSYSPLNFKPCSLPYAIVEFEPNLKYRPLLIYY